MIGLHCIACGKPLTKFAASITTRDGPVGWGPKCAKRVVIRPTRTRWPVVDVKPRAPRVADPLQPDLFEALA